MRVDKKERAIRIIQILRTATKGMEQPASVNIVNQFGKDPYLVLISCLLSLRTKDTVSFPASQRLFEHAKTPEQMLKVPIKSIEQLIYPTGFYHRKAALLHQVSKDLLERFEGKVPHTEEELLSIKGVGRKTANLVLGMAFDIPAICVDVHVHRISNRLGLVKTKTTDETEIELKKILPQHYWIEYNHLLVLLGQNICVPISPKCSQCAIAKLCPRVGVTKHR
jgi:endonuclease-3